MMYEIRVVKELLETVSFSHHKDACGELHRLINLPMAESLVSSSQQKGLCETHFPLHAA